MKEGIFKTGDRKEISFRVGSGDIAAFHGEVVHPVCSTFTLAREIEWATRQFVLDLRDDDEEGVGTFIHLDHQAPAFVGEEVTIASQLESINGNEVICTYSAFVDGRRIASGKTGQKILKREKLATIFSKRK